MGSSGCQGDAGDKGRAQSHFQVRGGGQVGVGLLWVLEWISDSCLSVCLTGFLLAGSLSLCSPPRGWLALVSSCHAPLPPSRKLFGAEPHLGVHGLHGCLVTLSTASGTCARGGKGGPTGHRASASQPLQLSP